MLEEELKADLELVLTVAEQESIDDLQENIYNHVDESIIHEAEETLAAVNRLRSYFNVD